MMNSLLIIDPQNDFCDTKGSLTVPNAQDDCIRLKSFIQNNIAHIDNIYVTLDTHHLFHIANPIFWLNEKGDHPEPFTIISVADVENGVYRTTDGKYQEYSKDYVKKLEATNRYQLCIWPPHCLVGSWGHGVHPIIFESLSQWEREKPGRIVEFTVKGSNPKTEHYSVIRAEVLDPLDSSTATNFSLLEKLKKADILYIAGEALSHCVANTVRDIVGIIPPKKIRILTDCTSNVHGFESVGELFLKEMSSMSIQCCKSTDIKV